jgi:hypothetical protein
MPIASLIWVLVAVLIVLVIAYADAAKYVIDSFFEPPVRMPALLITGVILLLVLLFAISGHFGVVLR